jgi:hypothetical protein
VASSYIFARLGRRSHTPTTGFTSYVLLLHLPA